MNLEQIRNKVLIQHNYVPNSTTYFGYVNNIINDAYVELFTTMPWSFNQKVVDQRIYPDVTPSSLDVEFQAFYNTTASGDFSIISDVGKDEIWLSSSNPTSSIGQNLFMPFVGQQIAINNFDYNIYSGYNYTTGSGIARASISPFYAGTGSLGGNQNQETNFVIKHNYYFLPADCVEVMDIAFRDDRVGPPSAMPGRIVSIPRRMDADYALSYQTTADYPTLYVMDGETEPLPPPVEALTLTTASSGLSIALPAGDYSIAYTYSWGANGQFQNGGGVVFPYPESPMSPVATTTLTASGLITATIPSSVPANAFINFYLAITNTAVDNRTFYVPFGGNGVAVPPDNPNPLPGQTTTLTPSTSLTQTFSTTNLPKKPYVNRFSNTTGRLRRIRFYPRPQGGDGAVYNNPLDGKGGRGNQAFFQIRYIYKPNELEFDTDVPEFPEEFHHLLVDRVLVDLYLREGKIQNAQIHQKKFDERMALLRSRYGTEKDTIAVRRGAWSRTGYEPYIVFPNVVNYIRGNGQ